MNKLNGFNNGRDTTDGIGGVNDNDLKGNINLNRPIPERDVINKDYKFLKLGHLRELEQMNMQGEISLSRMVELINELAYDFYMNKRI